MNHQYQFTYQSSSYLKDLGPSFISWVVTRLQDPIMDQSQRSLAASSQSEQERERLPDTPESALIRAPRILMGEMRVAS